MITRRLVRHLREQNWTAITIEFVLLVLGVFLGIQAANWNEAAADRRSAARYMDDIADDIRADIEELSRTRVSALTRIAASTHILREAGHPELAAEFAISDSSADDIFNGIERFAIPEQAPLTEFQRHRLWPLVVGFYVYDTNRSAFDALVSSGKIDLLDDREVLGKLREDYYLVNALDRTQTRTILPMRNHFIELGIARGLSPEGPVDEDLLVRKVGDDPALAASIAASREYAALHLYLAQLLDGKAHELQQLLKRQAQ